MTGRVIVEESVEIKASQLEKAIESLGSGYKQTPPVYSALKYQGKTLSKLARRETFTQETLIAIAEEKSREIKIYSCKLLAFQMPSFTIQARVSHGTYMRSLMNDIASHCGTHATTHELRRIAIGPFSVDQASTLQNLQTIELIQKKLITLDDMNKAINSYSLQLKNNNY